MAYRLRLLGRFELTSASGEAVPVNAKKTQALVAMLALAGGAPVPRSRLTAVLWGDRGEAQARSSLRQALTALRKGFEGQGDFPFRVSEESAAIDPASIIADTAELTGGDPADAVPHGEFLDGLDIPGQPAGEWLRAERQRLAGLVAERLAARLAVAEAAGDTAAALAAARALIDADPLNESAHRALMRAYAASGDRTRALKQFQACRDLLAAELGVEPEAETLRLDEEVRAGVAAAAPAGPAEPVPAPAPGAPPTVAVLPFANLSADPEQEYFSDGITEDIITALGRFRNLNVIARTSAFHFKGRAPLAAEIGEALGADFAVQGSIRKAGNRVRITVQLAGTADGRQLWAEHFDRELADIFAVQDEITGTVAGILRGRLEAAGERRAYRLPPDQLGAYELCLRARAEIFKFRRRENAAGRALLERALALDPRSATAHAQLSTAYHNDWMMRWVTDGRRALELAHAHAKTAVDLDPDDSRARWGLGEALQYCGTVDEARSQFEAGMRLNPNDAHLLALYGFFLSSMGEDEPAMELFERAGQLDPFDGMVLPWLHGAACYNAGRHAQAIELLTSIVDPLAEVHVWLAAANARLGRLPEARRRLARFLAEAEADMADFPGRRLDDWRPYCLDLCAPRPETGLHLFEGFAMAWPED